MKGQWHYYSSTRLCQCRSPLSVAQFSIANTSFCPLFCFNKSNSAFDASLKHDLMSLPDKGKRGRGGFLPKLSLCFRVCRIMLENRVLCFRASPVKLGYYAQNYARLEVLCSNYAGLKWHVFDAVTFVDAKSPYVRQVARFYERDLHVTACQR